MLIWDTIKLSKEKKIIKTLKTFLVQSPKHLVNNNNNYHKKKNIQISPFFFVLSKEFPIFIRMNFILFIYLTIYIYIYKNCSNYY